MINIYIIDKEYYKEYMESIKYILDKDDLVYVRSDEAIFNIARMQPKLEYKDENDMISWTFTDKNENYFSSCVYMIITCISCIKGDIESCLGEDNKNILKCTKLDILNLNVDFKILKFEDIKKEIKNERLLCS